MVEWNTGNYYQLEYRDNKQSGLETGIEIGDQWENSIYDHGTSQGKTDITDDKSAAYWDPTGKPVS